MIDSDVYGDIAFAGVGLEPLQLIFLLIWHPFMDALLTMLADPQVWIAFFTLTALELVLGIDNIIFISILVDKLPADRRETARRIGLFLAMFMRVSRQRLGEI